MNRFFLIIPLSISFACQTSQFVPQAFIDLGSVCSQHLVGPLDIGKQGNSFIKGFLVGSLGAYTTTKFKLPQNAKLQDLALKTFSTYVPNAINLIDIVKNHHSLCTLARASGFFVGQIVISELLK